MPIEPSARGVGRGTATRRALDEAPNAFVHDAFANDALLEKLSDKDDVSQLRVAAQSLKR